jgi:hypothetical protein
MASNGYIDQLISSGTVVRKNDCETLAVVAIATLLAQIGIIFYLLLTRMSKGCRAFPDCDVASLVFIGLILIMTCCVLLLREVIHT